MSADFRWDFVLVMGVNHFLMSLFLFRFISLRQFGYDSFGDVKPLRAVRVLRPLKLVSGTPSKHMQM